MILTHTVHASLVTHRIAVDAISHKSRSALTQVVAIRKIGHAGRVCTDNNNNRKLTGVGRLMGLVDNDSTAVVKQRGCGNLAVVFEAEPKGAAH